MNANRSISAEKILQYRSQTYRFHPTLRLHSKETALKFVKERGFIFFRPIKGIDLPSLWCATAGNRPVPNNHDDPGHITWQWKDDFLGKRKWFYAKVLRRKSTIISLKVLPYFFALNHRVHETLDDILYLYKRGKISIEEKEIFKLICLEGSQDSISIKYKLEIMQNGSVSRTNRTLELLQRDFRIMPSGISDNGRWNYSFIYSLVENVYPKLIQQSKQIKKDFARVELLRAFFRSNGVGSLKEIKKLFQWEDSAIQNTINAMIAMNELFEVSIKGRNESGGFSIPALI